MPNEVKGALYYNREKDEIGLFLNLHIIDHYNLKRSLGTLAESESHNISYFISFDDDMELQMEEKDEEWFSSDWQKYNDDVDKVFEFFTESQDTCMFAEKLIEFNNRLISDNSFPIIERVNIFSYIKSMNDVLMPCSELSKKLEMIRNRKIAKRERESRSEDNTMRNTEEKKSTIARYIGPTVRMKSKSLQNNEFYLVTLRTDEYAYVMDENNLKVFVNINVLDFGENNLERARSSCPVTNDIPLAQVEGTSDVGSLPNTDIDNSVTAFFDNSERDKYRDKYIEENELVKGFEELDNEEIEKMLMDALDDLNNSEGDKLASAVHKKVKKKKSSIYYPGDDDEEKATRIVGKVSEWAKTHGKTDSDIFHLIEDSLKHYMDDDDDDENTRYEYYDGDDDDDRPSRSRYDDDDEVDNGDSPLGLWDDRDHDDKYGNGDYSDHDDGEDDEGDDYY